MKTINKMLGAAIAVAALAGVTSPAWAALSAADAFRVSGRLDDLEAHLAGRI